MKIVTIGNFDKDGMAYGWHIDDIDHAFDSAHPGKVGFKADSYCLGIDVETGVVSVNGVEIVEWTEARKRAMALL